MNGNVISFDKMEQRLLRFLRDEFLEKGSKPPTMRDPYTKERDVIQECSLDLPQYRKVMARFEYHGIAKAIAIGAANGRVQIEPVIVEVVRQLDESNWRERIKWNLSKKWWWVPIVFMFTVVMVIARFIGLDTILKWFGRKS